MASGEFAVGARALLAKTSRMSKPFTVVVSGAVRNSFRSHLSLT